MSEIIRGVAYVVGDDIDTDQIIPAEHLSLVPTIEEEYRHLGGYALSGLPLDRYPTRLTDGDGARSSYVVLIAGRNFGCGSSREHAPIALGAAGFGAVIAESFARIFFRNCIATGELYPLESKVRLCEAVQTGDLVEVDLVTPQLRVAESVTYPLEPLGEVRTIVSAGGLFAYARQTGLVKAGDGNR
jgi:3-isopropylmalate/(R)-2-methylmalate dehydratase small subunit